MKKRFIFAPLAIGIYALYRRAKKRDLPYTSASASNLSKVGLSSGVVEQLPKWGYYAGGKPMEWMNLIIVGDEEKLVRVLEDSGWYKGDPITPWVLVKAFFALVFHAQYLTGPFTPIFVGDKQQRLSYQKPTPLNQFEQRHHARFWPTNLADNSGKTIWIAHASYDKGIKQTSPLSPPVHEIDERIDDERKVIVKDMVMGGAKLRGYIQFQPPGEGTNAYGDKFVSDGRAAVLEVF
ncbi:MAG: LssY C-terminal domain-containing protein [Candidatus Saccharimonadia bacterium]